MDAVNRVLVLVEGTVLALVADLQRQKMETIENMKESFEGIARPLLQDGMTAFQSGFGEETSFSPSVLPYEATMQCPTAHSPWCTSETGAGLPFSTTEVIEGVTMKCDRNVLIEIGPVIGKVCSFLSQRGSLFPNPMVPYCRCQRLLLLFFSNVTEALKVRALTTCLVEARAATPDIIFGFQCKCF